MREASLLSLFFWLKDSFLLAWKAFLTIEGTGNIVILSLEPI